jgi:hypothetical protein
MSDQEGQVRLDLDEVAGRWARLRPLWAARGLIVGPCTWRDARAEWPKPLVTFRSQVTEPESVGIELIASETRVARVVIWRGGWADIEVLADDQGIIRNPSLPDVAACICHTEAAAAEIQALPVPAGWLEDGDRWVLELWIADVIVLYDWLMSVDLSTVPVSHKAEKQALADLLNAMEQQVHVPVSEELTDRARYLVSKDMGW